MAESKMTKQDLLISLFKFTMNKHKQQEGQDYYIFRKDEEVIINDIEGSYIKENDDNSWSVYEHERGKDELIVTFPFIRDILEYFYMDFLSNCSISDYREEWEKETGLQF